MLDMIKMIVALSLICTLSGLTLASVRSVTKPAIEEQVLTYVQGPAIEQVLTDHENNPVTDRKEFEIAENGMVTVFPAFSSGKLQSIAFECQAKGFGGDIGVMVGFNVTEQNTTLSGIGITTMKETPGVGTRVTGHEFSSQFVGHSIENMNLSSSGGDINAVAGATISSTGTVTAVQKAIGIYNQIRNKLPEAWQSGVNQ